MICYLRRANMGDGKNAISLLAVHAAEAPPGIFTYEDLPGALWERVLETFWMGAKRLCEPDDMGRGIRGSGILIRKKVDISVG